MEREMARKARKRPKRSKTLKPRAAKASAPAKPHDRPMRWFWRHGSALVLLGVAALAWMSVLTYCPADLPGGLLTAASANGRDPWLDPNGRPGAAGEALTTRPAGALHAIAPTTAPLTTTTTAPATASAPATTSAPAATAPATSTAPASAPAQTGVANAAGIVGAYTAHVLMRWLGGGTYAALLLVTVASAVLFLRGRIRHLPLRLAGLVLLVVTVSSAAYMLNLSRGADPAAGAAGRLGAAVGRFLVSQFAVWGGWTILVVLFGLGVILTAERLVVTLPRLARRKYGAWRRAAAQRAAERSAAAAAAPSAPAEPAEGAAPSPAERRRRIDEIAARLKSAEGAAARAQAETSPQGPTWTEPFELPSVDLLTAPTAGAAESRQADARQRRDTLQRTLNEFGVAAEVVAFHTGPVITLFELSLAAGVKVSQVTKLAKDIARALAVPGVRVVSPLPGRDTIGVEVPNADQEIVRLRELMEAAPPARTRLALPMYLGKEAGGEPIVTDLARMPHLLIAGTTGSGKSVCLNTILTGLLLTRSPAEVRFVLVDPKMVEMAAFDEIPHLLCPVVHDMRRAGGILAWAADEMDRRYALLRDAGVKHIAEYNRLAKDKPGARDRRGGKTRAGAPTRMPYYVFIVDELADLIMTVGKDVEGHIVRIAQKARAVGIHLVLATQRPSVNVVTGLIKSNMPSRLSFRVASRVESRIILDQNGAEVLLGHGDMLLLRPGAGAPARAQGTFVADGEIRAVVAELRKRGRPQYEPALLPGRETQAEGGEGAGLDELFGQAVEILLGEQRGSVSLLQRRLSIGYARAARIVQQMAEVGILGPHEGAKPRPCRITLEDWREVRKKAARAH